MQRHVKHLVSAFVLAIFVLYMVPHEFVHAFYDHEDTEHADAHTENEALSNIHIHCDFLTFYTGEFLPADPVHKFECISNFTVVHPITPVAPIKSVLQLRESRGPPFLS